MDKDTEQIVVEEAEAPAPTDLHVEIEDLREQLRETREALAAAEKRMKAPPAPSGGGGEDGFFTPEEVRRMSPVEVREKMPAIRASMEKWK